MFDAVIVGAGPAGSAAARVLSQKGLRVFLADKDMPGAKKVCGGFLGPEASGVWKDLGLEEAFREFPKNQLLETELSNPYAPATVVPFRGEPSFAIHRESFDRWLFEKAGESGACLMPYTAHKDAWWSNGVWTVEFEGAQKSSQKIQSKILIYANGRRAPLALRGSAQHPYFACKTIYENIPDLSKTVSLHFVRKGHVGFNPLGNGQTAMCLYIEGSYFQKSKGRLDAMMQDLAKENPRLKQILNSATRVGDWQTCLAEPDDEKIFYKDHAFYVGDAVTMIQPVIGGGMPVAMGSGVSLAKAILKGLAEKWSFEQIAQNYKKDWTAQFEQRYRYGAYLGKAERSVFMSQTIFRAINLVPGLFSFFVRASRPAIRFAA